MEKYFGNAYRGDPGVPHAEPERFVNIWIGSAAFSAITFFNPHIWQLSNQFKYIFSLLGTYYSVNLCLYVENFQLEAPIFSWKNL
ncbi:Aminopeptidase-like protein AC3.5 [Senna tora]|uniref:Aminopeptidase-like protein AC3.5 n=1 Tax=Senna tora TaxID=362788 RepID=A0A834WCT6_9FABA|nr:Aminopeptidase-like protein AC3.5 [Senna tora]